MNERVFFNPGDAIANTHDFTEAMRSAQIYKTNNPLDSSLVVVKDVKDDKSFSVYFEKDNHPNNQKAGVIEYNFVEKI